MKGLMIICGLVLTITACNSDTEESIPLKDTSAQSGQSTVDTTGQHRDYIMQMHNAMAQMTLRMQALMPTGDADYDFASMMKVHHQGAIDMANTEIQGGNNDLIKQMAQGMVDDQQKEIEVFDKLLNGAKPTGNSRYGLNAMKSMNHSDMMKNDSSTIDYLFVKMMIPHHQSAITMSTMYLKEGKNKEFRQIAENIIKNQQAEVKQLQGWLQENKQ
jgi:uncharacterized protein (DUF305 family)